MKKLIILFLFSANIIFAQTTITVVGTMHNPTNKINVKSLVEVLNKISPDVILLELDSSFMDNSGNFIKFFDCLENAATKEYASKNKIDIRRYDFDQRQKFYNDHKIFENEAKHGKILDSLYRNNKLSEYEVNRIINYLLVNNVLSNGFDQENLYILNQKSTDKFLEYRQDLLYKDITQLYLKNESFRPVWNYLKKNSEFWYLRNDTMVKNILAHAKIFSNKRIVVFCGYYHHYYLVRELEKLTKENNIVLKNFWEY